MKIAVIGAGASGLCCSLMLARYGHEVILLEAGASMAPLLRGFSRQGLHFDTGFHQAGALHSGGILKRYLNFLGLSRHLALVPLRSSCCTLFRFASSGDPDDIYVPQGVKANAALLSSLWPEYGQAINVFFSALENAYFQSPFIDPRHMGPESLGLGKQCGSVAYLKSIGLDPAQIPARLKSLLFGRSVYYGTPPSRGIFEEMALVSYSMLEGVCSIQGGGGALAASFEKEIAAAGITFMPCNAVTAIVTGNDRETKAVLTGHGECVPCDAAVYTGHPARLPAMLPENALRPAMVRHLLSLEETHGALMLFGITRSDFLAGRDMLLGMNDDMEDAYKDVRLGHSWVHIMSGTPDACGRRPVFLGHATDSPQPGARSPRNKRPDGYQDWKNSAAEAILGLVKSRIPELNDLELVASASDYTMRDWVYGSTGSVYGRLHSYEGFPVLPVTRIKGLILAGQNIILPGLLGTFISGALACGSLVGFKRLFRDLACTSAE